MNHQVQQKGKKRYPIHFDTRIPGKKSFVARSLALASLVLFFWLLWQKDKNMMIGFMWFGIMIISFTLAAAIVIRIKNGDNFKKPKFALYAEKLLVKDIFANITVYPLTSFENEVNVQTRLFEQFIEVPGMKSIHISCLEKTDRQNFINALKSVVETEQ